MKIKSDGFTLVELIIFIVVLGLMASGVLMGLRQSLKGATNPEDIVQSVQLAQQRQELLLGQKKILGFSAFTTDPCTGGSPPAICTLPTGFSITQPTVNNTGNPSIKSVIVQLTGPTSINLTLTGNVTQY